MATKRTKKASAKPRTVTITFRGTTVDTDNLAALVKHYERTASDVLRRILAEEVARVRSVVPSKAT